MDNLHGMFSGFLDDFGGISTSASSFGDIDSGTYEVKDNTIMLTGIDGSTRNLLFFLHDADVNDIQLNEFH